MNPEALESTTMKKTILTCCALATSGAFALLGADGGKTTTDHTFALDLYRQLAAENSGKNLFFSPHSMAIALTMTAEGARGETAMEMGKVLGFPAEAVNKGGDARLRPWKMEPIHARMAELRTRFAPKAIPKELAEKIAGLRAGLDAANAAGRKVLEAEDWDKSRQLGVRANQLAERLNESLSQVDQYELNMANALFAEQTYPFVPAYMETIAKFYGTGAAVPMDFKNNHEHSRQKINRWVEENTQNRIRELIGHGAIDEYTRLVLCNAIHFKGEWSTPFDAGQTKEEDFHTGAGTKVRAAMMSRYGLPDGRYGAFNADGSFFETPRFVGRDGKAENGKALYPGKGGFVMAELPYKGKELSMVLVVPQDADGLAGLEQKLGGTTLETWLDQLKEREFHVQMPKFKLEATYGKMGETLKKMGMKRAFVAPSDAPKAEGAQFGGMSPGSDPNQKLYISEVCHKAFVEVNEKGTEAAAATAVLMAVPASLPVDMPFTPVFRADKPFLFAIRDVKSGVILFLGRVMDPLEIPTPRVSG